MTESFETIVNHILREYHQWPLSNRWNEAISFGAGADAGAYWIRDSEGLVNIVWLNRDGIRDITLVLSTQESMFNFLPLTSIVAFEIREADNAPEFYSLGVKGNYVAHVIHPGRRGHLYWVANTPEETDQLRSFVTAVFDAYIR